MGNIYCIMGKSSTGKDTIYQRLLENTDLKLKKIVPYTTRPIRANETEGVSYHFCSEEMKDALIAQGKVMELRSYDTCHGVWNYFTVDDGQIDLKQSSYLMIGTLESFQKIQAYYSKEQVIPIYIEVEDGIRLQRALDREKCQKHPKYQELCRRFLADSQDFAPEKIEHAQIERIFYNNILEDTILEITAYISEMEK